VVSIIDNSRPSIKTFAPLPTFTGVDTTFLSDVETFILASPYLPFANIAFSAHEPLGL
jgi:hypothetical protein